jgi:hypothetical protein
LQSMPSAHGGYHHGSDHTSSRSMLGMPISRSSHTMGGLDYSQRHHMGPYTSPHSAGPAPPSHYLSSDMPLSAPPSMSSHPFTSPHPPSQNMYPSFHPSPRLSSHSAQSEQPPQHYFDGGHSHSGSAPGSGYATPQ